MYDALSYDKLQAKVNFVFFFEKHTLDGTN